MLVKSTIRAAALALTVLPVAAQAGPIVVASCNSVASPAGCLFQGNINGNPNPMNANSFKNAEALYNLFNDTHPSANPDILLTYLADTAVTPGLITGAPGASGTWALPGFLVNFLAVKAGPDFVLYQITPASSGSWNTFDIPHSNNPRELSHIVFFGRAENAVPEPAAWGMMVGGFCLAGVAMRRRKVGIAARPTV